MSLNYASSRFLKCRIKTIAINRSIRTSRNLSKVSFGACSIPNLFVLPFFFYIVGSENVEKIGHYVFAEEGIYCGNGEIFYCHTHY